MNIMDHSIEYELILSETHFNGHSPRINTLSSLEGLELKWTFASKFVHNICKKNIWHVRVC